MPFQFLIGIKLNILYLLKELTTNQNQQILLITGIRKMRKGFYISNAKNNEEVCCQYKEREKKEKHILIKYLSCFIYYTIIYIAQYSIINNNPFFYFIYNDSLLTSCSNCRFRFTFIFHITFFGSVFGSFGINNLL